MPEHEHALASIAEHRAAIDSLDEQIVLLLNKRADESLAIRDLKPIVGMSVYDPGREEEILNRLSSMNNGPMSNENLHEIYETLLKVMKEIRS